MIVGSLLRTRSDDVIEAAWNAGIGVHALIWVCYAQRYLEIQGRMTRKYISSDSMVVTSGKLVVTRSLTPCIRTRGQNL